MISYCFARLFLCIYHFLTTQSTVRWFHTALPDYFSAFTIFLQPKIQAYHFFHQFIDLEESIFDLKTYFGFTGEPLHQILFYVNLITLVGEILQKMRAHSLV